MATEQTSQSHGGLRPGTTPAEDWFLLGVLVVGFAGAPLVFADSLLGGVLCALAGGVVAMIVIGMTLECFSAKARWERLHPGAVPEAEVGPRHPAHGICSLAATVAATAAWRDRIVDPDRRLATIVWSAVTAVRDHPDDAATVSDLNETEVDLRALVEVARDLDRRRDHGDDVASHLRARHARRLSDELLDTGRPTRDLA